MKDKSSGDDYGDGNDSAPHALTRDQADKHRCASYLESDLDKGRSHRLIALSRQLFVNRGLTASVELRGPPGARRLQCTVSGRRTMLPILHNANAAILIPDTEGQVFGSPGC
jgi:hypothetical protein